MTQIALISDIHSNLEAFEAVLADIDKRGISQIICLGDVVGYGPNPAECIDLVEARCKLTIRGNHDEAVLRGPINFNPIARDAIVWTRKILKPRLLRPQTRQRWSFLENLPLQSKWEDYLIVHGSPRNPISEYIMERDIILGNVIMFAENFHMFEKICFVGHTHMPGIFYDRSEYSSPAQAQEESTEVKEDQDSEHRKYSFLAQNKIKGSFPFKGIKMIINVGSVGQPRDRDAKSCYLTMDAEKGMFEFHRIPYNIEQTREKIHSIPNLDPQLGDRLLEGF